MAVESRLARAFGLTERKPRYRIRHRVAPIVLSVTSAVGVPFWALGLIVLDPWITAFGLAVQMLGKLWFLARMALLYDDAHGPCAPVVNRPE